MRPQICFLVSCLTTLGLCILVGTTAPAHASVKLCNETSYVLQVATAYQQGVASKSEGWTQLLPGDCQQAMAQLPKGARVFTYAQSDSAYSGEGLVFDGGARFCIELENRDFVIEGRRECRRRGLLEVDFSPIANTSGRPLVTFTEKRDFGNRRATMAGIQRLLADLQYEVGTIGGFDGQRTREASAAYRLRYQISGNPTGKNLLTSLIRTARQQASTRGLTLCNKTGHLIWAASSQLHGKKFESRGWIRIPARQCAPVISQSLTARFYFFYAEAVDATGLPVIEAGRRKFWSGDFTMCAKQTRFVIIGDTECRKRGYDELKFRKIDTGADVSWLINLD